jgi:hypothetical protein
MTSTRMRSTVAAAAALAVTAVAAGCGSSHRDPSASSFRPGPCRAAAQAVLSAGLAARDALSHGPRVTDVVALTRAQQRLEIVRRDAAPADRAKLDRLVTAIALYRLHVVGHTATRAATEAVVSAQHGVVTRCVAQRAG